MPSQTISLCIITKNEEKYLEQCLNSVKELADEIIIVDTGSTDKTKSIAKRFGAEIFDFKWVDDFSAARNESLKHATKDWILVLDADEVIDEEGVKAIREFIEEKKYDAFSLIQKNYTNETSVAGFVNENHKNGKNNYAGWYGSSIVRLFRNKKGYEFEDAVHELVEPSIESKKGRIAETNLALHHYGNADPKIAAKKKQLYLELCKKKVNQNPNDSAYYELGVLHKENNNLDNAIASFKKSIELNPKNRLALYELGVIYEQKKYYDEAIKCYIESLRIKEDSESFQNLGVCYLKKGKLEDAYKNLVKAMLLSQNKYSIYNNLGAVLERSGNYESAMQMLEIGIKLNPKNTIGFYNLGIVLDKKGDYANAIKNYEKAVELGHSKKEDIQKRIRQLKDIIASSASYNYGFKIGG